MDRMRLAKFPLRTNKVSIEPRLCSHGQLHSCVAARESVTEKVSMGPRLCSHGQTLEIS